MGYMCDASMKRYQPIDAGKHTVMLGDITRDESLGFLRDMGKIDFVYVDPPWTQALLTRFRSGAGYKGRQNIASFFSHLSNVLRMACPEIAFIEMGLENSDILRSAMKLSGFDCFLTSEVTYSHQKRPMHINVFSLFGKPLTPNESGDGTSFHGAQVINWAFSVASDRGYKAVFDPCLGLGKTLKYAQQFGIKCFGVEIDESRLRRALVMNGLVEK